VKEEGFTPLIIGVLVGSSDVVKKLVSLPNIDLDTKAEGVGPAVYDAARRGKLEMVKAMKEAGADMNNVGGSNEIPPLSIAIAAGHNEVARYLINQAKVDVNIEGKDGASPVFHAAQVGNFEMLKLLKKAGANLDTVGGPNKVSAVAIASETGFLKLVDYFISEGVDLNRQGLDGDTPVYLAASRGHLDIVKALQKAGANLNIPSGQEQFSALGAAILTGNSNIAIYLVRNGADVNQKTGAGSSPPLLAAQEGQLAVLEALADAGADLEAPGGRFEITPIALASLRNHADVVKFLVDQGVDVAVPDVDGDTALDLAERQGYQDIVRILQSADQ